MAPNRVTKHMIADFMHRQSRPYPQGVSISSFNRKVMSLMRNDVDLTLSAAITIVQASAGSFNNPH